MKKNIMSCLFICLFLLSSLSGQTVWAEPVVPEVSELKMQLALTHLMVDVADSLDRKIPAGRDPFQNPEVLANLLRDEAMKFEKFYEKSGMIPEEKIPVFRKFIVSMKWHNLVALMKKAHLGIDIFLKRKGYGFALSMMMGKAFQMGLSYFCMHHNLQAMIPVVMSVPWTILATNIPARLQKRQIENEMADVLGSKEAVSAFKEQERKFLEVLQLAQEKDFFLPLESLENGYTSALVVKNQGPLKKILNMVGMNEDELTLINLKKFLKDNHVESGYISWLLKTKTIDDLSRTVLISLSVIQQDDLRIKFQMQFQSQFREFKSNRNWEKILSWARSMKEIEQVDELIAAFKNIPEGLTPKEAALVWNDLLFPHYIEKMNFTHEEGRNLVLKSDALKVRLATLPASAGREDIENEMTSFLSQVLSDKPGKRCQTPAALIGEKLLLSL